MMSSLPVVLLRNSAPDLPDRIVELADTAICEMKKVKSLSELRDIRDVWKARQYYAECKNAALEGKNACAKVVVHATRLEGEAIAGLPKAKGAIGKGVGRRGKNAVPQGNHVADDPPTLAELGISKKEAFQAQRLASIPDDSLQQHFADVEMKQGEITMAGVLRLASKDKPAKQAKRKTSSNEKGSAHSPIDLCAMEVRRIVLAAIRPMSANDAAALIAELRDELDDIEKVATKERSSGGHHTKS